MLVEIKGYCRALNIENSLVCEYEDVTIKERKMRNGRIAKEILVKPEGRKRGVSFSDGYYQIISMQEATTGKKMLQWGE